MDEAAGIHRNVCATGGLCGNRHGGDGKPRNSIPHDNTGDDLLARGMFPACRNTDEEFRGFPLRLKGMLRREQYSTAIGDESPTLRGGEKVPDTPDGAVAKLCFRKVGATNQLIHLAQLALRRPPNHAIFGKVPSIRRVALCLDLDYRNTWKGWPLWFMSGRDRNRDKKQENKTFHGVASSPEETPRSNAENHFNS